MADNEEHDNRLGLPASKKGCWNCGDVDLCDDSSIAPVDDASDCDSWTPRPKPEMIENEMIDKNALPARITIEMRGKKTSIVNFMNYGGVELQVHDTGDIRIVDMCNNMLIMKNVSENEIIDLESIMKECERQ